MNIYSQIDTHRIMLMDVIRNDIYLKTIKKYDLSDKVILDLGSGLGLHGLIASMSDAKRVYLVDPSPILDITAQVVKDNNLDDKVICIKDYIENVILPEKVDFIISALTGNLLFNEDLLLSLFHARNKYLNKDGIMIPDMGKVFCVPVSAKDYYEKYINIWNKRIYNLDYSTLRKYAVNTIFYDKLEGQKAEFLSKPKETCITDFNVAENTDCSSNVSFLVHQTGILHGFLGWFDARMGSMWLSTSPKEPQMHWSQGFFPLATPLHVKEKDIISLKLKKIPFGDWYWSIECNGYTQKLTTFLSNPIIKNNIKDS